MAPKKQDHTQGPWLPRRLATYAEPGWAVFWTDTSRSGAHVRRVDYKGSFTEADARLIAAAPEMLKALRDTAEWFEQHAVPGYAFATRVRDVIAKATELDAA